MSLEIVNSSDANDYHFPLVCVSLISITELTFAILFAFAWIKNQTKRQPTTTNHTEIRQIERHQQQQTRTLHTGGRTHVSPVDWWYFQFDSISWRRNEMVWTWTQKKSNHNHINLVSFRSFVCSLINFGNYKRRVFITLNIEQRTKRTTNEKNVSESISAYNISTLWSLYVPCPCVFVFVLSCRTLVSQCSM